MTYNYNPATQIGQMRLLCTDTNVAGVQGENSIFSDEEYAAFFGIYGEIRLAAAQALDTMAVNRALVDKKIKLLDIETDGPAVAKQLQAQAKELRRQVNEDPFAIGVIEQVVDVHDYQERVLDEYLRGDF